MPPAAPDVSFGPFFRLGIEHIFTGYDHLLFLLALLLVCTRWRELLAIVTCFTVGHTVTLGLATAGLVNLPPPVAEPLIAFTILFVGVENVLRRGTSGSARWAPTLLFGLVHGFGFATVLRDLGVGQQGGALARPLFAFNLGVECGQLLFAAIVLPLLWRARRHPAFVRTGVPALSALIALTGFYWLVERLLLG